MYLKNHIDDTYAYEANVNLFSNLEARIEIMEFRMNNLDHYTTTPSKLHCYTRSIWPKLHWRHPLMFLSHASSLQVTLAASFEVQIMPPLSESCVSVFPQQPSHSCLPIPEKVARSPVWSYVFCVGQGKSVITAQHTKPAGPRHTTHPHGSRSDTQPACPGCPINSNTWQVSSLTQKMIESEYKY